MNRRDNAKLYGPALTIEQRQQHDRMTARCLSRCEGFEPTALRTGDGRPLTVAQWVDLLDGFIETLPREYVPLTRGDLYNRALGRV